ncbi:MAG: HigA family addiction module antidote protein [Spirochaetaceae bacterium]|jgi:addiction module HigA family antidote|nr:HigA family addiction module antidote protein [Spirochaetaceae bacterium]
MAKKTVLVPGEELKKKLEEYNIPISVLSADIGLSVSAVRQIITNRAKISLHIARRLAKYFAETSVAYWTEIQTAYDIAELDKDPAFAESFKKIPRAKKIAPPAPKAKKAPEKTAKKAAPKRGGKKAPAADGATAQPARKPRTKKAPPAEQPENAEE